MSDRIDTLTEKLDALSKAISQAYDDLAEAEDAWNPLLDAVAEALREEYRDAGRRTDPAEHTVLSAARLRHPAEYGTWRRAKREVAKLEVIAQNRRSELSGEQTRVREGAAGGRREPSTEGLSDMRERARRGRAA